MQDLSPTVLFTGSQGGGKSRTAAEKIHAYCLRYPGSQALVMRKVRDNVIGSAAKMLDRRVIGKDPRVRYLKKEMVMEYLNGSIIYLAGMFGEKQREAVRSIGEGAIDIAWMEEAHEFEEDDFEELLGRMRGAVAGWDQIILTTNPDSPLHWIYRRLILGKEAVVHYSSARDNPYNSASYHKRLDGMTGQKEKRLKRGLWVRATGTVIDTWVDNYDLKDKDRGEGNVVERADYIDGLPVWLFADDGYAGEYDQKTRMFKSQSHPRVLLLAQVNSEGQIIVFHESYAVKKQKAEHLAMLKKDCKRNKWAWPRFAVYDSASPSLGAAIKSANIRVVFPATKNMKDSVDVLIDACAADRNGWREILVHPRCRFLRYEMNTWAFDKHGGYGKFFDNGPDALRYGKYYMANPSGGDIDIETSEEDGNSDLNARIDELWDEHFESVGLYV